MKFQEFFVPEKKRPVSKPKKEVKFANEEDDDELQFNEDEEQQSEDDDEQSIDEEGEEDDDDEKAARNLFDDDEEEQEEDETTEHQKRLERIKAQIEQFEHENIEDKHWTLRGEATAKARPLNSLLEEDLEFDHSSKVKRRRGCYCFFLLNIGRILTIDWVIPHKFYTTACSCDHTRDYQCIRRYY